MSELTDERLREILAGCEGVTPGPRQMQSMSPALTLICRGPRGRQDKRRRHPVEAGEVVAKAEWYLDATDPADGALNICDIMQDKPFGRPVEIHHATVVAISWHAKLLPADDADSDDEWECEAATEGDCLRLIAAEIDRRAALAKEPRP